MRNAQIENIVTVCLKGKCKVEYESFFPETLFNTNDIDHYIRVE